MRTLGHVEARQSSGTTGVPPAPGRGSRIVGPWVPLALVAHLPLSVAIERSSSLATLYALATFALGAVFVLTDQTPRRTAAWAGYVAAAELLWRFGGAATFWE